MLFLSSLLPCFMFHVLVSFLALVLRLNVHPHIHFFYYLLCVALPSCFLSSSTVSFIPTSHFLYTFSIFSAFIIFLVLCAVFFVYFWHRCWKFTFIYTFMSPFPPSFLCSPFPLHTSLLPLLTLYVLAFPYLHGLESNTAWKATENAQIMRHAKGGKGVCFCLESDILLGKMSQQRYEKEGNSIRQRGRQLAILI